jgi:hypothetical protein
VFDKSRKTVGEMERHNKVQNQEIDELKEQITKKE